LPLQEEIAIIPPGLQFISQSLRYFSMPVYHGKEQNVSMPAYHGKEQNVSMPAYHGKSKISVCQHIMA
jgi:hypothetical protein